MSASTSQTELRLVVLDPVIPGSKPAVCSILGLQENQQGTEEEECSKYRGEVAGRKVVVVSSPAWFSSSFNPEKRKEHISSLIALSSPGYHVFLLCVPVNHPADGEAKALDVLLKLFGPSTVSGNTIILFTHAAELEEDEPLEEYLVTWRKDLLELVERCGERYHTLQTRNGEAEEKKAVEELLEKVEQMVSESGSRYLSSALHHEAEEKIKQRQMEIVRKKKQEKSDDTSPTNSSEATQDELEAVREEAERSIGHLDLELDSIFPSASQPAPLPRSFLRGLWEKLTGWFKWLPDLVRGESLLGALVGLFVGGPFGGMIGATVGSVATEVGRRKTEKTK